MALGPLTGIRSLIRYGVKDTIRRDLLTVDAVASGLNVARDATSGIYAPANWTEWQTMLTASNLTSNNAPYGAYLFQESTGPLTDVIGAAGASAAGGTPQYQVTIPGWTRRGIGYRPGTLDNHTSTTKLALQAGSWACIAYVSLSSAPSNGTFVGAVGNGTRANEVAAEMIGTHRVVAIAAAGTATGSNDPGTSHRPYVVKYDKTHSSFAVYTDQEIITAPFVLVSGFGTAVGGFPSTVVGTQSTASYWAEFSGPSAELTDGQVRTLLQTLGWTVAW